MHRRHFAALLAPLALAPRFTLPARRLERTPLPTPETLRPDGVTLTARAARVDVAPSVAGEVWTVGTGAHGVVAPTLRVRTGDTMRLDLANELAEPTVLHWHGLSVPEAMDGGPRMAIGPGQRLGYRFPVRNRAGTYWYHAHPHMRTGAQVTRGMAGLLLIGDDEEDALALPSGAREIGVIVQERRLGADGSFDYAPAMHERMEGWFGETVYGNGAPDPMVEVDTALHRVRLVNGTPSRILRLALSNGAPMMLIGTDGGLLPEPVSVDTVDLGTGERVDLLVDFSDLAVGTRVMLRSLAFDSPAGGGGGMGGMGRGMGRMMAGGIAQGEALDLLEFVVARAVRSRPWQRRPFPAIERLDPATARTTRTFRFDSMMMQHSINGQMFDMDRVDVTVPFGSTEIWRFVNPGPFPHPVHVHEIQFQVLRREGGRGRLFPWEGGWKDTVLVHPDETVDVIARFDAHRGRYLLHCHNLVHEDGGMMLNYEIA
ncbi:MAG: multicopper oxidase domain-containing protein [Gemmatimonadetes bacterium]|nr:multicopper oxidase domain-containing protein [Gemmatimonadota bacterium]